MTLTSRTRQLSLRLLPLPSSHVFEAPEASPGLFQACPIGHGGLPRGVVPHTHFSHPHLVMSGPWYWELIVSLFPPRGLLALFWEGGVALTGHLSSTLLPMPTVCGPSLNFLNSKVIGLCPSSMPKQDSVHCASLVFSPSPSRPVVQRDSVSPHTNPLHIAFSLDLYCWICRRANDKACLLRVLKRPEKNVNSRVPSAVPGTRENLSKACVC